MTYGKKFMEDKLSIGGNLKMMQGETYYQFIRFNLMEEGDDTYDDILNKKNKKNSTQFGLDLGAMYKFNKLFRVGLTGRNLNGPKFKYAGPGKFKIDPQYRLGGAFQLSNVVLLTADMDITTNESESLDGFDSRMFGLGAELRVPLLAMSLRGGMFKNLAADEGDGMVTTMGLGFQVFALKIDLATLMASDKMDIEVSESMPQRFGFSFAMSLRF